MEDARVEDRKGFVQLSLCREPSWSGPSLAMGSAPMPQDRLMKEEVSLLAHPSVMGKWPKSLARPDIHTVKGYVL